MGGFSLLVFFNVSPLFLFLTHVECFALKAQLLLAFGEIMNIPPGDRILAQAVLGWGRRFLPTPQPHTPNPRQRIIAEEGHTPRRPPLPPGAPGTDPVPAEVPATLRTEPACLCPRVCTGTVCVRVVRVSQWSKGVLLGRKEGWGQRSLVTVPSQVAEGAFICKRLP